MIRGGHQHGRPLRQRRSRLVRGMRHPAPAPAVVRRQPGDKVAILVRARERNRGHAPVVVDLQRPGSGARPGQLQRAQLVIPSLSVRGERHAPLSHGQPVQVRPAQPRRLVVVDVERPLQPRARGRRRRGDDVPKVRTRRGAGVEREDVVPVRVFSLPRRDDERESRPRAKRESLHVHLRLAVAVVDLPDRDAAHLRGEAPVLELGVDDVARRRRPRGDWDGRVVGIFVVGRGRHRDGDNAVGDVHAVVGAGGAHEELALVGIFRAREREVGQAAAGAAGLP